jgi:Cu/Ag efflux protein CusF
MRRILALGTFITFLAACSYAQQGKNPPAAAKKEYVFKGKVEKIDLNAKSFTVKGEKVEGWMDAMTMNYVPDKEDVLKKIKVGDQITAKVYDGDFRTLHDVQVTAASKPEEKKDSKAPAKK